MKIVNNNYVILTDLSNPLFMLKQIESAGRTCYRSENKITDDSCIKFCKMLINRGHEAMLEHTQLSVRFTTSRALANELVRHRICSFAQESTRYCSYGSDKFNNEIKVIEPEELIQDTINYNLWWTACKNAEDSYMNMLNNGIKPEFAREVLPLSLATELVVTANIREWRNIFKLRSSANKGAHPQMRLMMDKLLNDLKSKIPVLLDDIKN